MTSPAPIIRRLALHDAALFRDIRLAALAQSPGAFGSTLERATTLPDAWFAERLAENAIFGAFLGAALMGIAALHIEDGPKDRHKGTIWSMFVRPEARGAGLGAALVQAIIDHASGCVEQLLLAVVSDNLPARRLYESLGFVEWGREPRALKHQGVYADEVHMIRFLDG